jgi:hypothetical protein
MGNFDHPVRLLKADYFTLSITLNFTGKYTYRQMYGR